MDSTQTYYAVKIDGVVMSPPQITAEAALANLKKFFPNTPVFEIVRVDANGKELLLG